MAVADIANLIVSLKLDDTGFSGKLNAISGQLGRMESGLSQVGRGVGQVGSGLSRMATVAGVAAAGGLAAVVSTAVSFEDAFAGVRKTVDATEAQFLELEGTFREMARTIPVSFEELARLGETAGALGIAREAIDEFVEVTAQLGVTTDVSADQAATSLGVLSNVLHLTAEDYDNFGSTLVDLGNKGASTESQILAIAERAGAGGALIGVAADETLGWSSAVANLGIEVEAGGTALQKFFVETLKNLQDDDTLQVMADTAGMTGEAFKKAFAEDASGALEDFIIGLGELGEAERLAVLEALGFTDIRITRALLGLAGDTSNLTDSLNIAASAWQQNTALATEAEKRFATTASQMQILKNNVRDAAAVIGSEMLPVLNEFISDFVGFLNEPGTQRGLAQFAQDLAAGVRGLATELRGTDFSGIIAGVQLAAQVAKTAFDAFRALPAPIQQLAVAAFAVNKVTGGAIGQIAAGLGNILLGSLKTITAGHVTVIGTTVTGGAPLPGPAGGAGGAVRNVAAVGGGIIGGVIGKELIEAAIAPAISGVSEAISAAIATNDRTIIQGALDRVREQMASAPGQIALALNVGGVGTALRNQEASLVAALAELEGQGGTLSRQEALQAAIPYIGQQQTLLRAEAAVQSAAQQQELQRVQEWQANTVAATVGVTGAVNTTGASTVATVAAGDAQQQQELARVQQWQATEVVATQGVTGAVNTTGQGMIAQLVAAGGKLDGVVQKGAETVSAVFGVTSAVGGTTGAVQGTTGAVWATKGAVDALGGKLSGLVPKAPIVNVSVSQPVSSNAVTQAQVRTSIATGTRGLIL